LLPASIPFRFLTAALLFHVLGWTALAAGAPILATTEGGLGLPVAGLHLMTLGVLTVTAMGAGLQLLPVAIQADLPAIWPCRLISWLLPGVAVLGWGMMTADLWLLGLGGSAVALALLVFVVVVGLAVACYGFLGLLAAGFV
jgi:hypothetical protein